ncbi:MAG: hypothetical protein EBX52_02530 [Proteobacteria bacterium]|nr:hypothetical protein [Pseudomonadota bacterium]
MKKASWMILPLLLICGTASAAEGESGDFRTPATRYGSAYSVKVTLVGDDGIFVVPMWVKPDQKTSVLDPGQLSFMGWNPKNLRAKDVILSVEHLGAWSFQAGRSDWAVKPEYPKNCCAGVIGQDILKFYRLRFDPREPAHVQWSHVGTDGKDAAGEKHEFERKLGALFSVKSGLVRLGKEHYDLSVTPFELDFPGKRLTFETLPAKVRTGAAKPVFDFEFTSIQRDLEIRNWNSQSAGTARNFGLSTGARVRELNGVPVSTLTRYEIEEILRGKKGKVLEIGYVKDPAKQEKSKVYFDFDKNGFIGAPAVQAPPGRN